MGCGDELHFLNPTPKQPYMNHPFHLSKADHQAIIQKIAEIIAAKISIDLDELIVIPTATVAQLTGLSPKSVSNILPITEVSSQKRGVILKTLRNYLLKNTREPNP